MSSHHLLQWLARLLVLISVGWQLTATAAFKDSDIYTMGPPAAWVKPTPLDAVAESRPEGLSDGSWYLLLDRQLKVGDSGDEHYQHVAVQVVNAAGVEQQSEVSLGVDPSYQTLVIHSLRVVRQGVVSDQRRQARITVLPQESDLEEHIYNGGFQVNILLSDVQVGDVIEYSYTIRSRQDLYPGHYARRLDVGWSVPVHRQRVRLLYPAGRPLRYRFTSAPVIPAVTPQGDTQELLFTWNDLAAVIGDDDTPDWYSPWPVLELTDFADWGDVARRAQSLYVKAPRSRPRLDAAIASIDAAGGTPQQKVMRALQMVQDSIRYTSISIGRGSHTPTDPEVILERQFGDCKDKSLLLSTILGKLGIDARPALVHSERGQKLIQLLPSPYAFDHVIVRVQIGTAVYWLDGTSYKQYSSLQQLAPADFGYALPIADTTTALEKIPRPLPGSGQRRIETTLDLSKGMTAPATLKVDTHYHGFAADSMRDKLARGSTSQRATDYLNYYARYYPGVKSTGPMTVDDHTERNELVTHEQYVVDKTFTKDDDGNHSYWLQADEFANYGSSLKASVRSSPLQVGYPDSVQQVLTVQLPEAWGVKDEKVRIDNPAFRYQSEVGHEGRTLRLSYEYQALADHVEPAALEQYIADRARIDNDTSYRLWKNADAAAPSKPEAGMAMAPAPFLTGFFALLLSAWLAWNRLYRLDPAPAVANPGAPQGIGGWLILPAIGVVASPFFLLYAVKELAGFINAETWSGLPTVVSAPYTALAQPVLLALIVIGCAVWVGSLLVAVLFFRLRSSAPGAYIALLWAGLLFEALTTITARASGLDDSLKYSDLIRPLLSALLWTAYMQQSQRVRATFVRRLAPATTDGGSAALRTDGGQELHPGQQVRPENGLAGHQ